ncbi:DNA modification methylase [Leucobacter allii]|uniref:DNA modification methylase n=1 Tax=Leucobacter allii TaxID=2932247 RepID=A0ABY4FIJ5_9MICO|nr:DNA modification methylase [Leucobacter allii]UOQ56496.1 DNA modification methylase [Leucobacter allii]
MKFRIASSIALAAALALGATGCSLIAPQGTLEPYAPSDGIDVSVGGVHVRNIMLIADETGENFNVVFGAVNSTGAPQDVTISFTGEGSSRAAAEFTVPTGNTLFGNPAGEEAPVLVTIPDLKPGATVSAYFQTAGASELQREVPVLDGTLADYRDYVLPADFSQSADESAAQEKTAAEDEQADQSHVGDDVTDVEQAETE